jgi:ABC-2 type transport system permease protein
MGFTFGLVVWLPLVMGRRATGHSPLPDNFLILVAVYALTLLGQVSYWNAFGFDRSAAQVYFSLPVSLQRTLISKNLAAAIFIFLEIGAVILACLALRVRIPPAKILEVFLVTPPAALFMLALGNLSSVHYPRAMSAERVSQGSAAGRFQALMFIFYPLALLPVFMAFVARYAFASETAFYLVLGLAAVVGAVVYRIALESAVATAGRRREILIAELSRGEGPVAQA